jgi:DNA modification methylase
VTAARVLSGADRWAIVHGENLATMRAMPSASVHLVYGDAPFNTGRDFKTDDDRPAYSDKWPSLEAFVEHVRERCAAARDLLTDDGCLIVQVDPETSHYVKVALDGVFGRACFANEIVWRYRRWPTVSRDFQRMHDTLLRYLRTTTAIPRWNQLHEARSESTLATWGTGRVISKTVNGKRVTTLTDEPSLGAQMSDVWEIGILAPSGNERLGYPTQKPRALADRIVSACSHPGDVVLDPWCGSGTTISAAVALGRRGIGLDQSPVAVEIATARLVRETTQRDWLQEVS